MPPTWLIVTVALLVAAALGWNGRRDLTRPAVAFGISWFGFVALAQARLTDVEQPWSWSFAAVVIGGGLLFVVAATAAGGTAPARGNVRLGRESLHGRRLAAVAAVLIVAGCAGAAYKAHLAGGVPLLSSDPDAVRGRLLLSPPPTWATALTNGFYLGAWCALLAMWVVRPLPRPAAAGLALLALAGLLGASLEASRNVLLFALAVPVIAAYVTRSPGRQAVRLAASATVVCAVLAVVGGLYVIRVERSGSGAKTYVQQQTKRQPSLLRPLIPLYINAAFPLEAARRLHEAVPDRTAYRLGAASLTSLPDKAFPGGKPAYGETLAALMRKPEGQAQVAWTVGSYQGRLLADLGWVGVLLGSALLGLAAGAAYRWARGLTGLAAVAIVCYLAYFSAYLIYDNHLSFSLIWFFDIAVLATIGAWCTGRADRWAGRARARLRPTAPARMPGSAS